MVNIGNIGHTPGLLRVLGDHLPDVNITLIASLIDDRVCSLLRRRFPDVRIVGKDVCEGKILDPNIRRIIEKADLFIRNSNTGSNTEYMNHLVAMQMPFGVYGKSLFPGFPKARMGKGAWRG